MVTGSEDCERKVTIVTVTVVIMVPGIESGSIDHTILIINLDHRNEERRLKGGKPYLLYVFWFADS